MIRKIGFVTNKAKAGKNIKRLLSNATSAFMGNMGSSVINIISMALMARTLGVSDFGVFVLITTFLVIVNTVVSFQSWQVLIKYGNSLLNKNKLESYGRLILFGYKLDAITALVGFLFANLILLSLQYFNLYSLDYLILGHIYSFVALVNIKGTPIAVLRGLHKFNKVAQQQIILSLIKLVLIVISVFYANSLNGFVLSVLIAEIIGGFILVYFSLRELYRNKIKLNSGYSLLNISKVYPKIWSFLISSSLNSSLRLGSREVDVFVIGALLTAADVGIYKIAKQFSGIVGKVIDPLYQAIYPELVDLVNKKSVLSLKSFAFRVTTFATLLSVFIWLGIYFSGEYLIQVTVGEGFLESYFIMLCYMAAVIISSSGFVLQPLMLALGRPELSLKINFISTIIYILLMIIFTLLYGVVGTASSYIFYYIVWTLLMALFVIKGVNKISNDL